MSFLVVILLISGGMVASHHIESYISTAEHQSSGIAYAQSQPTVTSFALDSNNTDPTGVTFGDGKLFVVDGSDDRIYVYSAAGTLDRQSGFALDSSNETPTGVTFGDGKLFVVDSSDDRIYGYSTTGSHDESFGFELTADNADPRGISSYSCKIFVVDHKDDMVYSYQFNGTADRQSGFALASNNTDPTGVTFGDGKLFVVDRKGDMVYIYSSNTTDCVPPKVSSIALNEGNGTLTITFNEVIDASSINTSKMFVNDSGKPDRIPLTQSTVVTDSDTISIQLTEPLRQQIIMLDTPVLVISTSALSDPAGNIIYATPNLDMNVTVDTIPPVFSYAEFTESAGTLTITFNEVIDASSINTSKMFVNDSGKPDRIPLTQSTVVTDSDSDTISIQLTESLRQQIIMLDTPVLGISAGAVMDTSGTSIVASIGNRILVIDTTQTSLAEDAKEINIASWNLFDFGGKFGGTDKVDDPTILDAMTDVISNYDIIFVQEIANLTRSALDVDRPFVGFNNLCDKLDSLEYTCEDTGVINDGEGYGVIYKIDVVDGVVVERTDIEQTVPHIPKGGGADEMRRPPMKATLDLGNADLIVYNSHTQPTSTSKEIKLMSDKISDAHNQDTVIVLGDLNADGQRSINGKLDGGSDYYRGGFAGHPNDFPKSEWRQTVTDNDVTNFAKVQRAYDRIILSNTLNHSYDSYGILGTINSQPFNEIYVGGKDSGKSLSDHKLVWVKLKFGSIKPTDSIGTLKNLFSDYTNSSECKTRDVIYARGEGFVSDKTIHLYITEYPGDNTSSKFESKGTYKLRDVTGGYNSITTNTDGAIPNTLLWNLPTPGNYNIVADVNTDGYFTYGIDVVDAVDSRGLGISECKISDVEAGAPSAPIGLTAHAGNNTVSLSWDVPENDGGSKITDYIIMYKQTDSNRWLTFNDEPITNLSTTVTGLTNDIQYSFRVAAQNFIGVGALSDVVVATPSSQTQPTPATGTVTLNVSAFDDSNSNGIRDVGEVALPGIAVLTFTPSTDDIDIILTGADGTVSKTNLLADTFWAIVLPPDDKVATAPLLTYNDMVYSGILNIVKPASDSVYSMSVGIKTDP